jgi:hypothetical protein
MVRADPAIRFGAIDHAALAETINDPYVADSREPSEADMINRVTAGFGRVFSAALAAWALTGCSPAQQTQVNTALNSQPGQLFCRVQTSGGGAIVVAVVNAAAVGLSGPRCADCRTRRRDRHRGLQGVRRPGLR